MGPTTDREKTLGKELRKELQEILGFWAVHGPDARRGGFLGRIDGRGMVHPEAPKGGVLHARILWSFSAGYQALPQMEWRQMAERAYTYIHQHFFDPQWGGAYWSVQADGTLGEDRKQIYGQAFFIYGLSEFYKATGHRPALEAAISLFRLIEEHAYDPRQKGYLEAFSRDWGPLEDRRLSAKDANDQKTANTHLHILEAYVNLYGCWKDPFLKEQIENLLEVFAHHLVDHEQFHLNLFFDEAWNVRSTLVSYGHDMEAAWLLDQCAQRVGHAGWMVTMKTLGISMVDAACKGLDADGGLEYESDRGIRIREKHWWPQAEALVGFYNAYQISGDIGYLQRCLHSWDFIKRYLKDGPRGEWHWGVDEAGRPMIDQDKLGFWKCPYHNSRACLEIMRRVGG